MSIGLYLLSTNSLSTLTAYTKSCFSKFIYNSVKMNYNFSKIEYSLCNTVTPGRCKFVLWSLVLNQYFSDPLTFRILRESPNKHFPYSKYPRGSFIDGNGVQKVNFVTFSCLKFRMLNSPGDGRISWLSKVSKSIGMHIIFQ